jgi:hypothetical protein
MLSCLGTEITLTGTQTFSGFWPSKFRTHFKVKSCQVCEKPTYPFSVYKWTCVCTNTHIRNIIFISFIKGK